jgi:hypothetical protein
MRLIMELGQPRRPSLGVTDEGWLLAGWDSATTRLTITCQPNDRLRYLISRPDGETLETASGTTSLRLIRSRLAPYDLEALLRAGPQAQ